MRMTMTMRMRPSVGVAWVVFFFRPIGVACFFLFLFLFFCCFLSRVFSVSVQH